MASPTAVDCVGYLDSAAIGAGGLLQVHGWILSVAGELPVDLEVRCSGRLLERPVHTIGIASPDVQRQYPHLPAARKARFDVRGEVPAGARETGGAVTVAAKFENGWGPVLTCATTQAADGAREVRLFRDRFDRGAREVLEFLRVGGVDVTDKRIAEIGCGDGSMALGVAHKSRPRRLTAFDVTPVALDGLKRVAREAGVVEPWPPSLEFKLADKEHIPADDHSYDVVFSWSTFEHVEHPARVLREAHRILRPDGTLMIQIWPLYYSQHGSHLWDWFPDGFAHLTLPAEDVIDYVRRASDGKAERSIRDFQSLNRLTLAGLQAALREAGIRVRRLELMTDPIEIPETVDDDVPFSDLATSGVKLLAVPR